LLEWEKLREVMAVLNVIIEVNWIGLNRKKGKTGRGEVGVWCGMARLKVAGFVEYNRFIGVVVWKK
jgi:hypothetical protein